MTDSGQFPTRKLGIGGALALKADGTEPRAGAVNQHIEGRADGTRVMLDTEVASLLHDPFAVLVLRRGVFPLTAKAVLDELDKHNGEPAGVPDSASFMVFEGSQIPVTADGDRGGARLVVVRGRGNAPELMVSCLLGPKDSTTTPGVLVEVLSWDPDNRTLHFYQLQSGQWFWCGQSDMSADADTRGRGPFDSHVNGYPLMKELKTPWVHWHGPDMQISPEAFAADDPLRDDPLFTARRSAYEFEDRVRELIDRWNTARFDKMTAGAQLTHGQIVAEQILASPAANLTSTNVPWVSAEGAQLTLPTTFFFDEECLVSVLQIPVDPVTLQMVGARYKALAEKHDLRVRNRDTS